MRILIVDDEPDITSTLKTGLERHGFQVDTQNDPLKALADFKPDRYAMILLDIRMPKMTGFELYRELKKKDEQASICFLTAFDIYYDEFKKMFPDMEVSCFLRKPIRISDLVVQVKAHMR
jgi:DNA-binding response OmpR family regulator